MSRITIGLAVAISLCLAWCCKKKESDHGQSSLAASENLAADGGARLYASKCAMCHGSDGTAGIAGAANLQVTSLDSVALQHVIADGRNAMPAFKTSLSAMEIRVLAGYIKTLKNN